MLAALAVALAVVPAAGPEEAVRAADVALDRAVAAGDGLAFGALLEEDAAFAGGSKVSRGRAAVVESWRPLLAPGGPRLRWAPLRAEVARSGDLAFTTGRWTLEAVGKDGKTARSEGEYVTVWRRGADGAWRALIDGGLVPAARLGEGLARSPLLSATSAAGDLEATLGTWTRGQQSGWWLRIRRVLLPGGRDEAAPPGPPPAPAEPRPVPPAPAAAPGNWTIAVDAALAFPPERPR